MTSTEQVLQRLSEIPFQKVRDSPTIKYYTDWKRFEEALKLDYAGELTTEAPYAKITPNLLFTLDGVEGSHKGLEIIEEGFENVSEVYRRDWSELNKMEAYHILRNRYIARLTLSGGETTVLSPSPKGYLPTHLVVKAVEGENTLNIADLALDRGLKTLFVEVDVEPGAELTVNYFFLHQREAPVYTEFTMNVGDGAKLWFRFLGFGGYMSHIRSHVHPKGRESEGYTYGSLIARTDTKTDVITNVTHHGDYSKSVLSVRGGVLEKGYLVHRGAARILNVSHEAETAVKSYLTIFGEHGAAHSIPMLEVDTGIVAGASHSTSVSRLDEYRLFYLRKMGLSESEIVDLLLRAYVEFSGVAEKFDVDWRGIINT